MKNQALKQFMEAKGLLQREVAQMLGVSVAVVNQYLKGSYTGRIEEVDAKVEEVLRLEREKRRNAKFSEGFVETLVAQQGMDLIRDAHSNSKIGVIIGAAGLGKTQLLKQYAHENPLALLVETNPAFNPKVLMTKIAQAVGVNAVGTLNDLFDRVAERLQDSKRVLLIDEAELLSTRCLEFIRRLHDLAKISVILVGMPRLLINLKGKNGDLAQMYSRAASFIDLGNALCEDDLRLLLRNGLGEEICAAEFITASRGNARRLNNLMRGVSRLSVLNECEINPNLIKAYEQMLIH